MADIKNTFTSGKMNKDLDERLVPNGQYIDAMNIDVAASTTDNVGSVHNSFGNTRKDSTNIAGGVCVGSVLDKETQTIIWFVCGTTYDGIIQYDPVTQKSFPVLISAKEGVAGAFLNFHSSRLITGINVMDGFLYWTDNYSEPKKANIERCKSGVASSNIWTTITKFIKEDGTEDGNILEKHLTIIKRYPLEAPGMELSKTKRTGEDSSSLSQQPQNTSFVGGEFGDGSLDKLSNIYTRGSGDVVVYNQDLTFDIGATTNQFANTITIDTSGLNERHWQSITTDWYFFTSQNNRYEKVSAINYSAHTVSCANGIANAVTNADTITFVNFHEAYNNNSFWTYKDSSGDVNIKPVGTSAKWTNGLRDAGLLNDGSGDNIIIDSSVVGGTGYAAGSSSNEFTLTTGGGGAISSTGNIIPGLIAGHIYKVEIVVSNYSGSGYVGLTTDNVGASRTPRTSANGTLYYTFKCRASGNLQLQKESTAAATLKVSVVCLSGPREVKIQELIFDGQVDYNVGDVIKLTKTLQQNSSNEEDEVSVRVKLTEENKDATGISAPTSPGGANQDYGGTGSNGFRKVFNCEIISIDSGIANLTPADASTGWDCKREKDDSLFTNIFPRFGYRWKYMDNEYSAISPFTEVAFLPIDDEYEYDSISGYNVTMENDVRSIVLKDFQQIPNDVIELDILYKESNNTNIYTIKTLKKQELETLTSYEVTTELLQGLLPSNQLLRPYDNVPRKAKAQEITGNRLLYGNYTQQYNIEQDINIDAGLISTVVTDNKPVKSAKSIRTYQVGASLLDKYGRQTPVFSSDNAVVEVKPGDANNATSISAKINSTAPSWATHYKLFVKDNSSEYYNLAMDRFYQDESDDHVWLSFSSNDTNKIDTDDFIILKKKHDSKDHLNTAQSNITAKYKVLAKENSAPAFIRKRKVSIGRSEDGLNFATNNSVTDGYPQEGLVFFTIRAANIAAFTQTFEEIAGVQLMENKYIKICNSRSGATTDYYQIESVEWSVTDLKAGAVYYTFRLKEPFGKDISLVGNPPGSSTRGIYAEFFEEQDNKNLIEFEGRFFVKILRDDILNENVLKAQNNENYIVVNSQQMYWVHTYARAAVGSAPGPYTPGSILGMIQGGVTIDSNEFNSNYLRDPSFFSWVTPVDTDDDGSKYDTNNVVTSSGAQRLLSGTKELSDYYLGTNVQGWAIDSAWSWHLTKDLKLHATGSNLANDVENRYMGHGFIPGEDHCDFRVFNLGEGAVANHYKTEKGYKFPPQNKDIQNYEIFKALTTPGTKFRWSNDPGEYVNGAWNGKSTIYTVLASEIIDTANVTTKFKAGTSNFDKATNKGVRIHLKLDKKITWSPADPTSVDIDSNPSNILFLNGTSSRRQASNTSTLEILQLDPTENTFSTKDPAVFETEPKEKVDLNIYYETPQSDLIIRDGMSISTTYIDPNTGVSALTSSAAVSKYKTWSPSAFQISQNHLTCTIPAGQSITIFTKDANGRVEFSKSFILPNEIAKFPGATKTNGVWNGVSGNPVQILQIPATQLKWHNCYSFGNGVESNRIHDDFNAVTIDKGPKVSATLDDKYMEEIKTNSLIYSGLYNKSSSLNNLNQFIQAEKITKDLNPEYGTIQKLFTRNTNVVIFCENKILKVLSNKDALFNADGNPNVIATNKVLGQTVPFLGEFGISKNPESFANYGYRIYFSDKDRNAVLRLSEDGLTDISKTGMATYFRDNLKSSDKIIGSYDEDSRVYNLTLNNETVSFSEDVKGWTSRKSFVPESGLSMDSGYYTFRTGKLWLHGSNELRNNFYAVQYSHGSSVKFVFNQSPSTVKTFKTLSYEGTEGWIADSIKTELQSGKIPSFTEKEGLWFNYIKGDANTEANLDEKQFTTQGLGSVDTVSLGSYPVYHELVATAGISSPTELRYFVNTSTNTNNKENVITTNYEKDETSFSSVVFYVHSNIVNGQKWEINAANTTATISSVVGLTIGTPVLTESGNGADKHVICTIPVSGTMPNNPASFTLTISSTPILIQN